MEKILLTPQEAAEALGIGRTKTYQLIGSGTLPVIRIGRSVRIPVDGLRKWLEAQPSADAG